MCRCEKERLWREEFDVSSVNAKMNGCEGAKMICTSGSVQMRGCDDEKIIYACEDAKMWKYAVEMHRSEDEKMMRRCEDVKMYDRPPVLKEPFAETLPRKTAGQRNVTNYNEIIVLAQRKVTATKWPCKDMPLQNNIVATNCATSATKLPWKKPACYCT